LIVRVSIVYHLLHVRDEISCYYGAAMRDTGDEVVVALARPAEAAAVLGGGKIRSSRPLSHPNFKNKIGCIKDSYVPQKQSHT